MNKKLIFLIFFGEIMFFCRLLGQGRAEKPFSEIAKEESLIPVRPGIPGKAPFWNKYAKRFIYAPAFDYKMVNGATKYRYEIFCLSNSMTYSFESKVSYAPLSPVWGKMPVSYFKLTVIGLNAKGDSMCLAGSGTYYRASPYDPYGNIYHDPPLMPYDRSAMVALDSLLHKPYVNYWLLNGGPDPDYRYYQYPSKMYSALIQGAVTYARLKPHTDEAKRAIKIAVIVANCLLNISYPKDYVWQYLPPTYYGKWIATRKAPFIRLDNSMPFYGTYAGNAYLDLYDLIGDEKYFRAAKRIAHTYLKTQLKNGSWYLYANPKTGESTSNNVTIPIRIIDYLTRLEEDYKIKGLKMAITKAFTMIMNNPVKTFNWQAQFEDVGSHNFYKDLSKHQACNVAIYLFKYDSNKPKYLKLAEELVRFAEDQFVIWESPRNLTLGPIGVKGFSSKYWITPCVMEQYTYWMPVTGSAALMLNAYWHAYMATKKNIYLAKAKSIANTFTLVQKINDGMYTAYFSKYPIDKWLNSDINSAMTMEAFGSYLKK